MKGPIEGELPHLTTEKGDIEGDPLLNSLYDGAGINKDEDRLIAGERLLHSHNGDLFGDRDLNSTSLLFKNQSGMTHPLLEDLTKCPH